MTEQSEPIYDHKGGTDASWYTGWDLSDERRAEFREIALRSREAKLRAVAGESVALHAVNVPALDPGSLMMPSDRHGLVSLSLFSGGGGLDLGFDRAGFAHAASFDTLEPAGATLRANRPEWDVRAGADGDVRAVDWEQFRGDVDVLHGGPPCQPFSSAGRQRGHEDERNMLPEFVRAVQGVQPAAFVAENVPAIAGAKFAPYLQEAFLGPLSRDYRVTICKLSAHDFGVPQVRNRVFFVGFRSPDARDRFQPPEPTHRADHLLNGPPAPVTADQLRFTPGVRAALGLADIGADALAPTMRSTLTGPRHTTSILSSVSARRVWERLEIWPNGVAPNREAARAFPAQNGHFRLSVPDCAVIQGFPPSWRFEGPVYMALGQIGNSVAPPVAYAIATALRDAVQG
jgi:DNA (cytosine-5)-methyltransferase 1